MTEREEKELRNYCAWLLKEYGFSFPPSDPVIPALYVIHRELMTTKKSNEGIVQQIKEAALKVNPTIYSFSHPGEAWKFQMAQGVKWVLVATIFLISSWGWYLSIMVSGRIEEAKVTMNYLSRIEKNLLPLIRKDKEGFLFLEFSKPTGDTIRSFTEYNKLTNNKIRVYLGKTLSK